MYPLSDIDIAVFFSAESKESVFDDMMSLHADICRALKRDDIDIIALNTAANIMLLDDIVRYGSVIYEGDRNFRRDFEVKIMHRAIDFKGQRLAVMGI